MPAIAAARYRGLPLDAKKFAVELQSLGVEKQLRAIRLWRESADSPGKGFTLDQLWMFYQSSARSDLDRQLGDQLAQAKRFASAAKTLRLAACELRWSLKAVELVHFDGRQTVATPLVSTASADVLRRAAVMIDPNVLQDAATLLDPPDDIRAMWKAAGAGHRVGGLADVLEAHGRGLRAAVRPGPRPDNVRERFFEDWQAFVSSHGISKPLHRIAELMFEIVVARGRALAGSPTPRGDDFKHERRRVTKRAAAKQLGP